MVTSNHVHLPVYDHAGRDVIPKSVRFWPAKPDRNTITERKEWVHSGRTATMRPPWKPVSI